MAEKRMFTKKITDSDAFTDMSSSAQSLYFHLNLSADDDGFCNKVKNCMAKAKASIDDYKVLIVKRFIIEFESGVIVIKHWRMHNLLRRDRYHQTDYLEEKEQLFIKDNGAYTLQNNSLATTWQPNGNQMAPKDSIGKDSIGKVNKESISNDIPKKTIRFSPPTLEEVNNYCLERKNNINPERFIDFYIAKDWMIGKNKMKDWKAAIRTWEKRDNENKGGQNETHKEYDIER